MTEHPEGLTPEDRITLEAATRGTSILLELRSLKLEMESLKGRVAQADQACAERLTTLQQDVRGIRDEIVGTMDAEGIRSTVRRHSRILKGVMAAITAVAAAAVQALFNFGSRP